MEKTKRTLALVFALLMLFSLAACGKKGSLWENAKYTQDKTFGNGKTVVEVEVKAEDKSVTFTVKTDKKILGDALLENGLIEGENGEYGMYIKSVNGIIADYNVDKSYWAFYKDGEYMMTGVDGTEIANGDHYELEYTK